MTRTREWLYGWLLLLPAAVLLALFTHYPAIANLWHSFQSTPKGARPARFVGLDNYRALVDDPIFWQALSNNLWYALGTIPLSIALALLMAVWVNERLPGRGFVRLAYFIEKGLIIAMQTFDTLLTAVDKLVAAGVIKPGSPLAMQIADAIHKAKVAFQVAVAAQKVGNSGSYFTAIAQAQAAIADINLLVKGG